MSLMDPSNTHAIKVLLVEDDPLQARLVRRFLRSPSPQSFEVEHAESLAAAVQKLITWSAEVVLLDLTLPDSSGANTFLRIQTQFPALPIVVLTGLNDEELGVQLVQAGAQDYLMKDMASGLLLSRTLRYAIERKRAFLERERLVRDLQEAVAELKTLSGLLPICSNCKKVRDDKGYWTQIEAYIQQRSAARFSHGICPDCMEKLYPDYRPKGAR
ncbi:MAG TPA: hypothetical protein DCP63_15460 [Bacteroidetes bacterium]|nr:hypothetical protein [Bacteroidota bacterium]